MAIMFEKGRFRSLSIACTIVVVLIAMCPAFAGTQVLYGPLNPGAENGFDHWMYGVLGGGSVAIDTANQSTGSSDFMIGITNTAPPGTNSMAVDHADFRCEPFALPSLGSARGPYMFSFSYKLPGPVKPGDNIEVYLRFFAEGNEVFLNQRVFDVGSATQDSEMTGYQVITVTNIYVPKKTVKADIWVVANIIKPWTSGNAYFDNFSVQGPPPKSSWGIYMAVAGVAVISIWLIRRSLRRGRE